MEVREKLCGIGSPQEELRLPGLSWEVPQPAKSSLHPLHVSSKQKLSNNRFPFKKDHSEPGEVMHIWNLEKWRLREEDRELKSSMPLLTLKQDHVSKINK